MVSYRSEKHILVLCNDVVHRYDVCGCNVQYYVLEFEGFVAEDSSLEVISLELSVCMHI